MPFHQKTLTDWHEALRSDKESNVLIQELIENCGLRNLESRIVFRSRTNLNSETITQEDFDSPAIEQQKNTFNRFQPFATNCLYVAGSEETAILETLPSVAKLKDIVFVSALKIVKPLKMLDMVNNISIVGEDDEIQWSYKPIFSPLFLNEDPVGITDTLKISRLLSQRIYEHKIDGIIYPSRCDHLAKIKRRILSISPNYLIFGSPVKEGKLLFEIESVKKYRVGLI